MSSSIKTILTSILKDKKSWKELKLEISKFNVHSSESDIKDTRAGSIFELFTKFYFLVSPTEKDNFKNVWLFNEIPFEVKAKLNLGNQDYGVDLVLQDVEDRFLVVQCKYKNDEFSKLNWTADKIANLFAFCPKADGFIVFSNASDLDSVSKTRHDNFTFYGIANLNEIEIDTFSSIYSFLTTNHLKERKLFEPLPHQNIAIQECVQWFKEGGETRGQLILPCGAGKTLAALWIKERLCSKNTLVLVPSLALLRQIKDEWSKQRGIVYQYLCVCSENDIDKENTDSLVAHTYEIDSRVTTDSAHILSFLSKPFEEKVIFSTYHSLSVVAEAIKDLQFEFDFTFCDEAHKTAGVGSNKFSLVHNNNLIPSKYRLYSTATPRIVKESLKKRLGDDLNYAFDMNDPEVFGYEFYRMTFKEAIEQDILVDYKIVAIGVNNEELKEFISQRRYIDKNLSIDELANNYALEHIMQKYNANHGLTFHSRVKLAIEFSKRHQLLFKDTEAFSVSGEQSTNHRNSVLDQFKISKKAIISNARCLTEGVDVPTIDLVYFCDPKNSKVDIVQAVGRALRKKEGKKIGLIVVPIYHSNRDNVENSISEGSFKNLLQVIRSLCDQDERLQEEINDLAFGKGKRFSKKIDVLSSNYFDAPNKIILEGFEDKLRRALYSQIIEKSSNNWDLWFLNFQDYLKDNNNEYPSKNQHQDLYNWVAIQRNRKKNGILKNEEIRKLNSINFVWNIIELKWEKMFLQFQEYSKTNIFPPLQGLDDEELVSWYRVQIQRIKENKVLSLEQKKLFTAINQKFEGPASRKKWFKPFNELVQFRQQNPKKWPQYNRESSNSLESELSVFCQTIRKRFRQGKLENYWLDKLLFIDFNFAGHSDNWMEYFNEIKDLLNEKKSISIVEIGNNAYSWIIRYKNKYDQGELSEYESKKIEELNLDRFFDSWSTKFEEVKDWVNKNKKLPSKISHNDHYQWLKLQRLKHKRNRLNNDQVESLKSLGYVVEFDGNKVYKEKWIKYFNQLKEFIENNNSYPSRTNEMELYNWVQTQRAAHSGTLRNRKPLSKERVDLLNSINFQWSGERNESYQWDENFAMLKSHINSSGILELPSLENGKSNFLYTWCRNQKIAFEKGKLTTDRVKAFESIGINFSNLFNRSRTKWEDQVYQLSSYLNEKGHLPRIRQSRYEDNLYGFLYRTKKAYKNNTLTKEQLLLLKELNIILD